MAGCCFAEAVRSGRCCGDRCLASLAPVHALPRLCQRRDDWRTPRSSSTMLDDDLDFQLMRKACLAESDVLIVVSMKFRIVGASAWYASYIPGSFCEVLDFVFCVFFVDSDTPPLGPSPFRR